MLSVYSYRRQPHTAVAPKTGSKTRQSQTLSDSIRHGIQVRSLNGSIPAIPWVKGTVSDTAGERTANQEEGRDDMSMGVVTPRCQRPAMIPSAHVVAAAMALSQFSRTAPNR
jgi:hypothetical protein